MNILAHAWLSGRNPEYLIGNFIGDFVKGNPDHPRHNLPPGIVVGIRMHRAIDAFTDSHADVATVRSLLRPRCHKYAGVAVDVFFDHFLAVQFAELTNETLTDFVDYFYMTLQANSQLLPPRAADMAQYMRRQDWVRQYKTTAGIDRALTGLARRTAFESGLETAVTDLVSYYDEINLHFLHFWPQLTAHISEFTAQVRT